MISVPEVRQHESSAGFTYLGVLFFIALMSIMLSFSSTLWSFAQQREKERELLFVGGQFRRAIGLYYERTPGTVKKYPRTLQDLLQDNRFVTTQRYLRRIYPDPMTGDFDWGVVPAPDGGIMGIHSRSKKATIKTGNFRFEDRLLDGRKQYSEWRFVYDPAATNKSRAAASSGS